MWIAQELPWTKESTQDMQRECDSWLGTLGVTQLSTILLPSPVVHRELISRIRRKHFVDLAQPLGQRRRSQQRIVALAQFLVIHVEKQRKRIHRNRIGEGSLQIFMLGLLRLRTVAGGNFAQLIRVHRGLAARF